MIYLKKIILESNKNINAYHGSSFEFDKFKTKRGKSGYGYSLGAYFSNKESEAKRYGKNVKQYTLKFKNLLDLSFIPESDKNGKQKFFNYLRDNYKMKFENEKSLIDSTPYFGYTTLETLDKKNNLIPKLKGKGIDGIAFNEGAGITYVVFNSDSIYKK